MPNALGKTIDKTYLSVDVAERRGFIHRDYIAHCLRWSHVIKYLQERGNYKGASILDLGCGIEVPLLKMLYSSKMLPKRYVGVDYGNIHLLPSLEQYFNERIFLFAGTNILDYENEVTPSIITMFEVLEHMEKDMGIKVLEHIKTFMGKTTTFFMSTPCYDGDHKAGNHVYEWSYQELYDQLLKTGFKIKDVWGTFASMKDYKHLLNPIQIEFFESFHNYYDVNMLACIFAPLFPAQSRNCLWQLSI